MRLRAYCSLSFLFRENYMLYYERIDSWRQMTHEFVVCIFYTNWERWETWYRIIGKWDYVNIASSILFYFLKWTCRGYPLCLLGGGVGLLLIRSWVLGNEAHENRNGVLLFFCVLARFTTPFMKGWWYLCLIFLRKKPEKRTQYWRR